MATQYEDFKESVEKTVANLRRQLVIRQSEIVRTAIHSELNEMTKVLGAIQAGIYLPDERDNDGMTCELCSGEQSQNDRFPRHFKLNDLGWVIEKLKTGDICCLDPEDPSAAHAIPQFRTDKNIYIFIKAQSGNHMFSLLVFELPPPASCLDTIDQHKLAHMAQMFTNAAIHLKVLTANENQVEFEKVLSELSRKFINLPADQIDSAIEEGLMRISEFFDIDRAVLFQLTPDHPTGILTHVYARVGITALPKGVTVTAEDFPYLAGKHSKGEVTYYKSIDDLPEEAHIDKQTLKRWGSRSDLAIPLFAGSDFLGTLSFNAIQREIQWPEDILKRSIVIGEIFANALARKRADENLRRSYTEIKALKDRLQSENTYFKNEIKLQHNFDEIIGNSEALKYVLFKIEQSAPTDATVLILGETGTGKELVARAIHDKSLRRERPLIKVDCGALQRTIIERELFGHEKGAFTGAHQRQVGRFEIANHGTLFLDEVGELPLDLQPKLLRVLQDGEFERLGNPKPTKIDVRIIAATNRDLEEEVRQGRFRRDLWYRLNVFPISIPPLRERREDIALLVNWFVNKFLKKMGKKITTIPTRTLDELKQRHWAGNIRELENTIERAVIISPGEVLTLADAYEQPAPCPPPLHDHIRMEDVEREHMRHVLEQTNWRISGPKGAAVILDINPSTLRFRIKKLGISK